MTTQSPPAGAPGIAAGISGAFNNLGNAEFSLGDLTEADRAYRRALQLQPSNVEAKINVANIHYSRGEWPQAETACRTIIAEDPDSPKPTGIWR